MWSIHGRRAEVLQANRTADVLVVPRIIQVATGTVGSDRIVRANAAAIATYSIAVHKEFWACPVPQTLANAQRYGPGQQIR